MSTLDDELSENHVSPVNVPDVTNSFRSFFASEIHLCNGFPADGFLNSYKRRRDSIRRLAPVLQSVGPKCEILANIKSDDVQAAAFENLQTRCTVEKNLDFSQLLPGRSNKELYENGSVNSAADSNDTETQSDAFFLGQEASSTVLCLSSDEKYQFLEMQIADLKKQVADLNDKVSKQNEDGGDGRKKSSLPVGAFAKRPIPPPPPLPPVLSPAPKINREKEPIVRQRSELFEKRVPTPMDGVLHCLQNGIYKLKPVSQSSPRTEAKSSRSNSDCSSIAELLKRKFENVPFDSPSSGPDENSFTQSFNSDDEEEFVSSSTFTKPKVRKCAAS